MQVSRAKMNDRDILFRTSRFNLSKVQEDFINPCCFGEDLAAWLRQKLVERDIEAGRPYQEDWGWEFAAKHGSDSYFLGMGGIPDGVSKTNKDAGQWRIFVEKRRSMWQRLRGRGRISPDDPMLILIEETLRSESDFDDVHRED